ncbi:MAG: hypothetical protein JO113_01735 [Candidatus Eremiobacteraeota bacterium]|nr:hypothetical protein [Candidatus Eremiobacteraeota bacterium]
MIPTTTLQVRAMREDRGRFAALHGTRVLIYWPHGFGDWIHFGAIAPLLDPSNSYAITRFGDDYVAAMEANARVEPLFSGVRAPSDGGELGPPHLGLTLRRCNGRLLDVELPHPLGVAVRRFAPDALLWTDYPETEGRTAYPFHTKARNLVRLLVDKERLATLDLSAPLNNAIDFAAPSDLQRRVDEILARFAPTGSRIGVISRRGITAARKNWGDGSEARAFVAGMRREPGGWRFISMDDEDLGENTAGFRALFGDLDEPFARLFKAFARRVELFVGIPAGPLHFALARAGIPTVGLWTAHHPDWYDEPNPNAVHIVGRYVRDRGFDRRVATTTKPPSLRHRLLYLDTLSIGAGDVREAVAQLIT